MVVKENKMQEWCRGKANVKEQYRKKSLKVVPQEEPDKGRGLCSDCSPALTAGTQLKILWKYGRADETDFEKMSTSDGFYGCFYTVCVYFILKPTSS